MTPTKAQQYHINILLFILAFLMGCSVDLYVPSLPAIVHSFHVDNNLVQMTIALYMLGYGLGQIVLGILSDVYGRKRIVIFSTILYAFISFLIAIYSPNIACLILYGCIH